MCKSISHDMLVFTQVKDTIAIRPLAALRPSKYIWSDEELSWPEMLQAKNTMLSFIAKSGVWPEGHVQSLASFYVNLELHPQKSLPFGDQALLLYQSRVRREWYDTFAQKEGFNIAIIQDELLCSVAEELNGRIIFREIDQVKCHPFPKPDDVC